MLTQTLKRVKLKGKSNSIIREQYLRDDLPCYSPLCKLCSSATNKTFPKSNVLHLEATHYVIPCLDAIENYLEVFELQDLKSLIFLQSVVTRIMQKHGHRLYKRVLSITKDVQRGSVIFLNEINSKTHVERTFEESFDAWLTKCCTVSAEYFVQHLNQAVPIVLITENVELCKSFLKHTTVMVYTLKEYLENMWKGTDSLIQLFDSLNLALSTTTVKDLARSYASYLPSHVLENGLKAGRFVKGHLRVNKHNASEEAFVTESKAFSKDSGDIFINGLVDRNRAIDGDEVVIELLPQSQWKCRSSKLVTNPSDSKEESSPDTDSTSSHSLPNGKVVGILDRCWRNYIATLPEEESSSTVKSKERILVVPYNYCIPKIRIVTRQAENIRNKRIVVRIDDWEKESQYPNGHIVQVIGDIGDLDTEVNSLLIEHDLLVKDFSQSVLVDLPSTDDSSVFAKDLQKRKDLRSTHLIFSIDPKGCQDVDDALSVRSLSNGSVELGVHIADVTHFVPPLSFLDLEAQNRSTTIYLPDRRYDMLPERLSADLCSLHSSCDRFAVSVLWEMDSKHRVQKVWYGRTIISSRYKLCYETAQDILLGVSAKEVLCDIPELQEPKLEEKFLELKEALQQLSTVANSIRFERLAAGGLELSSVDMKFEIDSNLPSPVTGVKSAKELGIHKTVAECMIFANHWVAKKISEVFPHQSLLRRHPNPREADLAVLQKLAASKGFDLQIHSNKELSMSLEKAVDAKDPNVNQILRILASQTMNQATYCSTSIVSLSEFYHYGLGLNRYTHFTSPIRRYADIIVHRLLLAAVEDESKPLWDSSQIEEMCHHMNKKHKAAQDIEKEAQQLFLASFLTDGILADACIYSLRSNGVLVFVSKYGLKGAVCLCNREGQVRHKETWSNGQLQVDQSCLIVDVLGEGSHKYRIFDHITVSIKVQKSRFHIPRIILDLLDNKPYESDWQEMTPKKLEFYPNLKEEDKTEAQNSYPCESKFNLYRFLEDFRACTLSEKPLMYSHYKVERG